MQQRSKIKYQRSKRELWMVQEKNDRYKEEFKIRIKQFTLKLIRFIDSLPNEQSCRAIKDQLIRSGTSIGANYFEAKSASSRKDYTNFFNHCLKSANESRFWLEILVDANKCGHTEAVQLMQECSEIANIFASSILTLKRNL
jgi:four helix bundle protein